MSQHNAAAWILNKGQRPLVVSGAPDVQASKDHVVIKVHCVAINPIDWIIQDNDFFNMKYPTVLGLDIAGEVHQVGDGVTDFKIGDKVIA